MQSKLLRFSLFVSPLYGLAIAASAFATDIFSPIVKINGDNHGCYLLNVGDRPIQVTAQFLAWPAGGSDTQPALNVYECSAVTLMPGTLATCPTPGGAIAKFIGPAYCKFTIDRNPKDVRASICVVSDAGYCVPAE